MQRVYEFHSLTAEAAQCGGNSDSTGPLHGAPVPPTLIHDTKGCEHLEGVAESTDVYRCAGDAPTQRRGARWADRAMRSSQK